jgi:hypothetical protein
LFDKKATKSREVRTDIRVGHGPKGGAWISEFTGNGKRMERDKKQVGG